MTMSFPTACTALLVSVLIPGAVCIDTLGSDDIDPSLFVSFDDHSVTGDDLLGVGSPTRGGAGGDSTTRRMPIHMSLMYHEMPAWPNLPGSKLVNPPSFMTLMPTTFSGWTMPKGMTIKFTCPNSRRIADVCDAWVFYYSCPQSCSQAYQGGTPAMLVGLGWTQNQCAPQFVTGVTGKTYEHPMKAMRIQLARGESTRFDLPGESEFLAFGIDMRGVTCSKFGDANACATSGSRCEWSGTECVSSSCGRTQGSRGQGPAAPCPQCPWEGIVSPARPLSDGPIV